MKALSSCDLKKEFSTAVLGGSVYFLESTGSTQDVARDLAASGAGEGALVIAAVQTGGRGRMNSSWSSPPGGLWMSIILRPPEGLLPTVITLIGAAAVARAAYKTAGLETSVRWPNDCCVNGKKFAGIIGEKTSDVVIAGIGVNLNIPEKTLAEAVSAPATSLLIEKGGEIDENEFLGELLKSFEKLYFHTANHGAGLMVSELERLSKIQGRSVSGVSGGRRIEGTAEGFGDDGSLIIRLDSGPTVRFTAGELSLEKETKYEREK